MIAALLDPKSYEQNTGSIDNWEILVSGGNIFTEWDGTRDITLPDGTVIKAGGEGAMSASRLVAGLFKNGNNAEMESLFNVAGIKWDETNNQWIYENGQPISADDALRINITSMVNNTSGYNTNFDTWLKGGMDGVYIDDIGGLPDGLFGYVNRTRLLGNLADQTAAMSGTPLEMISQLRANANANNYYAWAGEAFFDQYSRMYSAFVGHIGGSIAPNAQTMTFNDFLLEGDDLPYTSVRNGTNVHTGTDTNNSVLGTTILAGFGGRVPTGNPLSISTIFNTSSSVVTYETGFEFGGSFISTGLWIQDRHMDIPSKDFNYQNTIFGPEQGLGYLSGRWGNQQIAAHLHMDILTRTSSTDSRWFQNIFKPSSASDIVWRNNGTVGTNTFDRTYWNAADVWEKYWKIVP
jgi:hypothetical protein